jgi:hypothetical protein
MALTELLALVSSGFLGPLCVGVPIVVQIVSEPLVDNLGNSRVVEVCLSSGEIYPRLDLAALPTSTASMGYLLKAGQLEYDCRYSKMHGMPVTGGRGFRSVKLLWYKGVPP